MTPTRLPRKCAQTTSDLAAELGKEWPPMPLPEPRTQRHREAARNFKQTGETPSWMVP